MSLILKWSDFISTNIYDSPLIVNIYFNNVPSILLCIDARTLSHDVYDTPIDKNKEYKFFPTMGIITYDWWKSYLKNPRTTNDPLWLKLLENKPILSDDGRIIWFEGEITWVCEEKEIFLPHIWFTPEWVIMIQPDFQPWDDFIQKEIWDLIRCHVIQVLGIDIPIPSTWLDVPIPHKYAIKNWERYTFDCSFWEQSWMDYMYLNKPTWKYQNALFLSWLITDADFDPFEESEK